MKQGHRPDHPPRAPESSRGEPSSRRFWDNRHYDEPGDHRRGREPSRGAEERWGERGVGLGPYERGADDFRADDADDTRRRSSRIVDFGAYDYEVGAPPRSRPEHGSVWDHTDGEGRYRPHSAYAGRPDDRVRTYEHHEDRALRTPSGHHDADYHYGRPSLGRGTHAGERVEGQLPRRPFRGPKGYVRSDERIREEVCDRLGQLHDVDPSDVEVTVAGGEVTLRGTCARRSDKHTMENVAAEVAGVVDVHVVITVRKEKTREGHPASSATSETRRDVAADARLPRTANGS